MSEKSVQLVYTVFNYEQCAEEILKTLKAEQKEKLSGVQAAVAMRKDAQGKISYHDLGMTPGKGALEGVILGAIVGIVTGGTGIALGALGALVGSLMGKRKREDRISAERVNQVVASLPPGSSAIVAIVESEAVPDLEKALQVSGADTFTVDISSDLAEQLAEHQDAGYSVLMDELRKGGES